MKKKEGYAPIVVFAYNRVDKIKRLFDSLFECKLIDESLVFVYCDGNKGDSDAKEVSEVWAYVESLTSRRELKGITISKSIVNKGLAKSIIEGVDEVIGKYGRAIVLEDDLIVSNDFLQYMNDALDFYEDDLRYGSIAAYTLPFKKLKHYRKDVYVTPGAESWGWATWKNRWIGVDWSVKDFEVFMNDKAMRKRFEKIQYGIEHQLIIQCRDGADIWCARWYYHLFKNDMVTVRPSVSRIVNCGFDGTGANCTETSIYAGRINDSFMPCKFEKLAVNKALAKELRDWGKPSWLQRCRQFFTSLLRTALFKNEREVKEK